MTPHEQQQVDRLRETIKDCRGRLVILTAKVGWLRQQVRHYEREHELPKECCPDLREEDRH